MASEIILTNEATPSTPSTGTSKIFVNSSKKLSLVDDGGNVIAFGGITLGTPAATTSGTSVGYTGLPSTTKRITFMLDAVSFSGTDHGLIQLGTSSAYASTGYVSQSLYVDTTPIISSATSTAGFIIRMSNATATFSGNLVCTLLDSTNFIWTCTHVVNEDSSARMRFGAGYVTLSGAIDRIQMAGHLGGAFDAGKVNIMYE